MQKENNLLLFSIIGLTFLAIKKMLPGNNKLTKDFTIESFTKSDPIPKKYYSNVKELAKNLQVLKDYLKTELIINSGFRTPGHNKTVGGSSGSKHLTAEAADFTARGYSTAEVLNAIEYLISIGKMKQGGLGFYPTWIHYDVRGTKARW